MTVRVVTPPLVEPVTLAEARLWCRIDTDDTAQDAVITLLIQAMREYAENLTQRAYIQRTLELTLPCFPYRAVELPRAPLQSVSFIKYIAFDGTLTTIPAAEYELDTAREPGIVQPAYLESWPGVRDVVNAVQIRYVAGYPEGDGSPSDLRANMPAALKVWMQARLSTLFEIREQLVIGATVTPLPRDFADGLLDGLRIGNLFA